MNLLLYIGVILLSYGSYQLLCHILLFPTVKARKHSLNIYCKKRFYYYEAVSLELASIMIKKFELVWNCPKEIESELDKQGIFLDGLTFFLSQMISLILGLLLIIPLFFLQKVVFFGLTFLWVIFIVNRVKVFMPLKKIRLGNKKTKRMEYCHKLLIGAFFVAEIGYCILMFT